MAFFSGDGGGAAAPKPEGFDVESLRDETKTPELRPTRPQPVPVRRRPIRTLPAPDLSAIIPLTGESVGSWLSRRTGIVTEGWPEADIRSVLTLASQSLTDDEIRALSRVAHLASKRLDVKTAGFSLGDIGEGLSKALGVLGTASEAVTGAAEDAARWVGDKFDRDVKAAVGGIPEDIRDSVKTVVEKGLEHFGESYSLVEKATRPVLGPLAQSAAHVQATTAAAMQELAAYADPTGTIKHTRAPAPPSPQEMWNRAISMPVGDQYAVGLGAQRGSTEFTVIASTANFMVDWFVFGTPGKVAKGLHLAETVPKGAVHLRGLSKWAFELRAKPVEQLVRETKQGQGMIDALFLRSRDGNVNRLVETFPQLDERVAQEMIEAGAREEVEDVVVAAMRGQVMPASRGRMLARLDEIDDEARLVAEGVSVDNARALGLGVGTDANRVQRLKELTREHSRITRTLDRNIGKTVLRELPAPTMKTEFLDIVKRSPKIPGERRSALRSVASAFDKNWARRTWSRLPAYGIPVFEKTSGRERIVFWGQLFKFSRQEIDDYANRYLAAHSQGEVREILHDMMRVREHRLPPGTARESLQIVDHPLGFTYVTDDVGKGRWVLKVSDDPTRGALEYPQPLWSTQLADLLPTPDPRAVLEASLVRSRARDFFMRSGRRKSAAAVNAYIKGQSAISTFTSALWKPMVLGRLGWPIKVVALDEQARLAANDIPSLWYRPWDGFIEDFKSLLTRGELRAPEEVLMQWGREIVTATPTNGLLKYGHRGFGRAYQNELLLIHRAEEGAYMARHGKAATKEWLETGGGRRILNDMRPNLQRMANAEGRSFDDQFRLMLDEMEDQIAIKARTPELREALATGRIRIDGTRYQLDDRAVAEYFQTAVPKDAAPSVVRDLRDVWERGDTKWWKRFVGQAMENLGSRPTNYLSRSPAFRAFYQREVTYLQSRGISKGLAEKQAKAWAIRQTNDLLYNLGNRTLFDELHKNLIPFFPAWKEVLKTWSVNIPNAIGGPIIGQMTLAARFKALGDAGQELGLVRKNEHGEWIIDLGFYKTRAESLMMFGTIPGLGALHQKGIGELAKKSEAIEKLTRPLLPYGPEASIGPAFLNRLFTGLTGRPPPWEQLLGDGQFQEDQFNLAKLRQLQLSAKRIREIAAMPEGEAKVAASRQLVADAESKARWEYLARAGSGFFLPASPIREFESDKKLNAFRESLKSLPTGDRRNAYEDFIEENPDLQFMLTSRSFQIPGAPEREQTRDGFWRARRQGWVDFHKPEDFVQILLGFAEYDQIRSKADGKIAGAGTTARERLLNIHDVLQANIDKRLAQYDLERRNPTWAAEWNRIIAGKDGPVLDSAQQLTVEAHRMLGVLQEALKGQETDIDWREVRAIKSQLGDLVREYNIFTDTNDLAPGVDKTYARYFDDVFGPYMDGLDRIYSKLDQARTGEEVSAVMEEARSFRNDQTPKTVDGEEMPTPEEVLFRMKSDEDAKVTRAGWAMTPTEWLTSFQRETLGYPVSDKTRQYWDSVNKARLDLRIWRRENQVSSSSRAYRDRKDALESWERNTAVQQGLAEEYMLAQALPYQRLAHFKLVDESSSAWARSISAASYIGEEMRRRDLSSFNNIAGRHYASVFLPWLDLVRTQNVDEFGDDLERLRSVAPKSVREGPWYDFYAYMFLTGRTFGI